MKRSALTLLTLLAFQSTALAANDAASAPATTKPTASTTSKPATSTQAINNNTATKSNTKPENARSCYVQLGAFQNKQWAENQVAEVALLGIQATAVATPLSGGGTIYQVRTGQISHTRAQEIVQKLQENKINAFIAGSQHNK